MIEQALIDGLKFAQEAKRLQGEVPLACLPGVAEGLFERTAHVSYVLAGFVDSEGAPGIEIEVRGILQLVCQRCLGCLDFELARRSRLLLAAAGEELSEVDADAVDTEIVPAEAVANVVDLVEQEVLLGLPLAPMHPNGVCTIPVEHGDTQLNSPFDVLAQLKASSTPNEH